ncbi:uncharacterized protein G2W53_014850 [Senna tora]|uniref:Uncharacterized protein n=1 Tax=Senna tora TaxID=362788 RepID=A0A835C8U0_9FABA|nr:uncharacterized protein G2W53_014850 [Senna tora]
MATDKSLGVVVSLHQISRRRCLIAADLAGENAEVFRESEGEEASATVEEEVFGLERQKLSPSKEDPWPSDRSLGTVVSLQQILLEKMQKWFGRVKEKKPPPSRNRKEFGLEVSHGNLMLYSV